ncbi:transposase [Kribbella sp. VKM Ac-2568]|uniref:transposase n=1 Tax=Kribbella sp. VKM Ac-2568 TaxID=2512219 RepID=UPI0010D200A2|nr:transposase [Kribbella sp. VKM Ac-2568]TCM36978.1 DDE superfamily endonuclease [Kribbella sp. VKM Ac-2568]
MDNYATHKRVEVRDWLAANPRIKVHFTPSSGSWLNMIEVWFGIIERQAIHRGTFRPVHDVNTKIRAFITGCNDRCRPFVWTKTADQDPHQSQPSNNFRLGTSRSIDGPLILGSDIAHEGSLVATTSSRGLATGPKMHASCRPVEQQSCSNRPLSRRLPETGKRSYAAAL